MTLSTLTCMNQDKSSEKEVQSLGRKVLFISEAISQISIGKRDREQKEEDKWCNQDFIERASKKAKRFSIPSVAPLVESTVNQNYFRPNYPSTVTILSVKPEPNLIISKSLKSVKYVIKLRSDKLSPNRSLPELPKPNFYAPLNVPVKAIQLFIYYRLSDELKLLLKAEDIDLLLNGLSILQFANLSSFFNDRDPEGMDRVIELTYCRRKSSL